MEPNTKQEAMLSALGEAPQVPVEVLLGVKDAQQDGTDGSSDEGGALVDCETVEGNEGYEVDELAEIAQQRSDIAVIRGGVEQKECPAPQVQFHFPAGRRWLLPQAF